MKMSLSKLLRWGKKETPAAPQTPRQGKKDMGRAEQAAEVPTSERRKCIRWPKTGTAKMSWITSAGSWKVVSVWLKDTGDGGLGVFSRKPVETDRTVWVITKDGEDWQGLTRYCTPAEEGFQIGFERIKALAVKSDSPAAGTHLKWLEKPGKLALAPVSVRNASDGRIEVVTSKAVPTPSIAMLSGREVRCLATALACHKRGNRFLVEMEVVSDTYNNPVAAR
jgi:hypothetical protein